MSILADDRLSPQFLNLLNHLVRCPSVVGAEHSFFRILQRELEERGANVSWYEGLLVAQGSDPHSIMFSAHIDRHGLICTGPNEFQYAAFVAGSRSDLLGNSVSEQLMNKIVDRFGSVDVYAYEPWSGVYRGNGSIKRTYICEYRNNLIFELEGLSDLVAGTPVAFRDRLKLANNLLTAQLDNVLCAATLVYLFEHGFKGTAFFTAQEEAGKSWRYLLEWFRRFGSSTNQLVVIDTSPFPTQADAEKQHVVLRHKDANAAFNESLTQQLKSLCESSNISYQFKDEYIQQQNAANQNAANQNSASQTQSNSGGTPPLGLGSTELGRIIAASQGLVDGTTLQIPTSGYHTMEETANMNSVKAFLRILSQLAGIAA